MACAQPCSADWLERIPYRDGRLPVFICVGSLKHRRRCETTCRSVQNWVAVTAQLLVQTECLDLLRQGIPNPNLPEYAETLQVLASSHLLAFWLGRVRSLLVHA